MTPMYAACTSQMVPNTSDLVFVEFVVNDMYRGGGALPCASTWESVKRLCNTCCTRPASGAA